MRFKVIIVEHLVKEVSVEAEDDGEAIEKVEKQYRDGDIVLSADDFGGSYEISTIDTDWSEGWIDPQQRKGGKAV